MKSVSMFAWGELVAATADSGSEVVFHECQTLNVLFFCLKNQHFWSLLQHLNKIISMHVIDYLLRKSILSNGGANKGVLT